MAMGKHKKRQEALWVPTSDLPRSPGHPFYSRLNRALESEGFDRFVESRCRRFYAAVLGRPSLAPGRYFRLLLVGYFEGLDSERGMAWRAADSLGVRSFLGLGLEERAPEHSTISRTRRLIDLETHRDVFTWIQERLAQTGLLSGKTIAIDATTLEANAAMRSIVRRDTGETYQEFLKRLAKASGIRTPSRQALARLDRRRKKKGSNEEWKSPADPDAKIAKMKDGRTHLAHKTEQAVDLTTGAIVSVTVQGANQGDTSTLGKTLKDAETQIERVQKRTRACHPEACRKWLATRVTTPLRFSRSWTLRGCVRTYPNPTVVVGDGGATPRAVAWCTRTVGEAAGHEVSVCTASEENGWSDPSLISTEPAA